MKVRVFFHDRCFDGTASAALFSRFYSERIGDNATFDYMGLLHRAGALFNEADFIGDENVIVDFKYSASPKITWWFDHHQSAFLTPEDHEHFLHNQSNKKFYDPDFKSCTKFLATIAENRFGFNPAPVSELIEWADIVDGAQYKDAKTAVEMKEPAMKLTMVIESTQDNSFTPRLIPLLASKSLADVIEDPVVAPLIPPLMDRHQSSVEIMKQRSECKLGTIFFDVMDHDLEGYNKFVPYYLHPGSTYSVGLSKSSFRTKVSVGSNPWTKMRPQDMVNLAMICERYGGGGHARVGAISFAPNEEEKSRQAAHEIVEELRASVARVEHPTG
ncbi:MAG TPA: hypothetical protein VJ453_02605 [Terriglobales bacterium]|nr:hypothetical protein [Terriglobales bacterium]